MKQSFITTIFLALVIAITSCNSANKTNTKETTATFPFALLKERNSLLAKAGDWISVQNKAYEICEKIKRDSNDIKSKLMLAQLYMQEARITGEHPYYYPATLTILNSVLKQSPDNFEALAFKSSVQLSLHHFSDALITGKKAVTINPDNAFIYGVLCDANVELGNYDEAVKMSDKMQSLRPGLESYSRASYLREIYGNNQAAIEAMKMAVQAGLPGSEEASWAGNTMSHLLENTGDLEHAEEISNIVLTQRPSYAFATDALGRIALARGEYDKAIQYFETAIEGMPEFSFYENMAEAYAAKGNQAKATEIYKSVITMLNEDAQSGHYADLELANVYTKLGDYDNALKHAQIEYKRRPANIDVNSVVAWVYFKKGNSAEAKKYMDVALRMGTKNAMILKKAGMIEIALNNKKSGEVLLAQAQKINPFLKEI
ncbi:MAG: tetratricopeptide repeat protein [Bacteroidota bacterium]